MKYLNPLFEKKFKFTSDYFSTLIDLVKKKERLFPQGLVFEGADTKSQYLFAHELARILNCEKNGEDDCTCTNCKWINQIRTLRWSMFHRFILKAKMTIQKP